MGIMLAEAGVEGLSDMEQVFQTGLTAIQSDVTGFVKIAFPVALGIAGLFLAIRLGIRFFRSVAN